MANEGQQIIREAVGVFHDSDSLQAAIDELLTSGFNQADLSLLAGQRTIEEKLHHLYDKVSNVEDDPEIPRQAYISTESRGDAEGAVIGALIYVGAVAAAGAVVASGGALAAAIVAAAAAGGAGGALGGILAVVIGEHHARYIQEQLDKGGLLLWVRTWAGEKEQKATDILKRHSGVDVHIHDIAADATA